jgi:hypothetical protein
MPPRSPLLVTGQFSALHRRTSEPHEDANHVDPDEKLEVLAWHEALPAHGTLS